VTTLTIVKSDGSATQMYRIEVGNDAVAATIRLMIGNTNVTVHAIGDALVLDGKVNDEIEAQRAAAIAGAYKAQVVNLLEISKPRQVRIRIRIAEVNTEAIKNIGFQMVRTARPGAVRHELHWWRLDRQRIYPDGQRVWHNGRHDPTDYRVVDHAVGYVDHEKLCAASFGAHPGDL